jgi:hypothetical protein
MRAFRIVLAFAVVAAASIGAITAAERASNDITLRGLETPQLPSPGKSAKSDEVAPLANPLWAIRLDDLLGTRQRPIFSPLRRPPAPPPIPPPPPAPKPVALPHEPERPPLALVGTIVSESLQIAIFREEETEEAMRLKPGDDYKGWYLRSIIDGEVQLTGHRHNAVLVLIPPGSARSAAPVSASNPEVRHRKR